MLGFNRPMRVETPDRAIADRICAMIKHMTGEDVEPEKMFVVPHAKISQAFGETMHGLALNPKIRIDRNIVPTIYRLTVGWMETYHRFFLTFKSDPEHQAVHGLPYDAARYAEGLAQELPVPDASASGHNGHSTRKRRSPRRPQA